MHHPPFSNTRNTPPSHQIPIGLEEFHEGVVDIVSRQSLRFEGAKGLDMTAGPVPPDMAEEVEQRRAELIERVSEVSE